MDVNDEIRQLLNDQWNYHRGLEIFKLHGDNRALFNLLAKDPDSSFFNKKLKQELSKINVVIIPDVKSVETTSVPVTHFRPHIENWPDELKPVVKKRNEAVKERDFLRGKLPYDMTKDKRRDLAFRILDLDDVIQEAWQAIDYHEVNKALPPTLAESEIEKLFQGVSIGKVSKMLTNYRTYLTKAKKKQRPAEKIPIYEAVIAECERRLNNE